MTELETKLYEALKAMFEWAYKISDEYLDDEYLDGDYGTRQKFCDDADKAREAMAEYREQQTGSSAVGVAE